MPLVKPEMTARRLVSQPSRLLTSMAVVASRLVAEGLAEIGARRYHYALLSTLAEFGPSSQAALGRRTGIDRSDIVSTMSELEEARFIERLSDQSDRRRNVITITAKGETRLEELDGQLRQIQHSLLAPLTPAERQQLVKMLLKLCVHHAGNGGSN